MKHVPFQMPCRIYDVDLMVMELASKVDGILPLEARFRLELSVIEALTNLVLHAKTDAKNPVIDIHLTLGDDNATLEIFDPPGAAPFDLRDHARELSGIDPNAEGGRGLALIMDCADSVDYGPSENRHRLKLTFAPRP
jgi:serine/threonine-protein kinase RsbW